MDASSVEMQVAWDATPSESRPRSWQPPLIQEDVRDKIEALDSRMLFCGMDDKEGDGSVPKKGTPDDDGTWKKVEAVPFRRVCAYMCSGASCFLGGSMTRGFHTRFRPPREPHLFPLPTSWCL